MLKRIFLIITKIFLENETFFFLFLYFHMKLFLDVIIKLNIQIKDKNLRFLFWEIYSFFLSYLRSFMCVWRNLSWNFTWFYIWIKSKLKKFVIRKFIHEIQTGMYRGPKSRGGRKGFWTLKSTLVRVISDHFF